MNSLDIFGNPNDDATITNLSDETSYTHTLRTEDANVEEDVQNERSFTGFSVVTAAVALALLAQCFSLQVRSGSSNKALAEGNSVRILSTAADRGLIVDATGQILARNTRQLALAINPQTLPSKKKDREKLYETLRKQAGLDTTDTDFIETNRVKTPEPFVIKTNLSKDESLLFQEWFADTPGLTLLEIPVRQYTPFASAAQVLGYVGNTSQSDVDAGHALNELLGKSGIEKQYNDPLTGTAGKQKAEINARHEVVRVLPGGTESEAKTGQTLTLSIDSRLQGIVAEALKHELERRTKKFGELPKLGASVVVTDPNTGAIKAMVSLPDYDPQLFAQGISKQDYQALVANPGNPLLNRTIQGLFPPGSTIKPLVASAGLQAGVITADTHMNTPDAITIGNFRFPDWKTHGETNTRKAIAESNDIFFYAVGGGWEERNFKGLGIDQMNLYLRKFGLSTKLGIDIGGELAGNLGDDGYKKKNFNERWYIGDTYHSAIGQGFTLTTPLQMANAIATIANGGTLYQPQIGWSLTDTQTNKITLLPHTIIADGIIDPKNLQIVREGMRETVLSGSSRPLNTLKVTSAGKTGTAQFGTQGLTHAWYTGFAPYEKPEIAFSILIEGGGESFYSSVPVAEEILRGYFNEPLLPGQSLSASTQLPGEFSGEH